MYGILTRSQSQQEHQELREYSSFTMEDINALRIRFEALRLLILHYSLFVSLVLPAVVQQLFLIVCSSNRRQEKLL